MKKYCLIAAILVHGVILIHAQIPDDSKKLPKVKREAITNCGQGTLFMSSCGRYSISQTIGQQSVIGYGTGRSYVVLQGFQQPNSVNLIPDKDNSGILGVRCYPNPVTENLTLSLMKALSNQLISGFLIPLESFIMHTISHLVLQLH